MYFGDLISCLLAYYILRCVRACVCVVCVWISYFSLFSWQRSSRPFQIPRPFFAATLMAPARKNSTRWWPQRTGCPMHTHHSRAILRSSSASHSGARLNSAVINQTLIFKSTWGILSLCRHHWKPRLFSRRHLLDPTAFPATTTAPTTLQLDAIWCSRPKHQGRKRRIRWPIYHLYGM